MKKYSLESCVWELTLKCCFSCAYCGSNAGKERDNELNTKECYDVIKQLSKLNCKRVSLIGGEIFLRDDWYKIIKKLRKKRIAVSVITNGFLFTNQIIKKLKTANIESIAISIDSGIKDIHDKYRQEGSFDRAVKAMETLLEHNFKISIITTLNSENAKTIQSTYDLLRKYPISAWQIQACTPMGNVKKRNVNYEFDFSEIVNFVDEKVKSSPFLMGIAHNIGYYAENDLIIRGNVPFRGCTAGLTSIGIDSIGNVRGCESMYDDIFVEGNLRECSLIDIWENPDGFEYNRKYTIEKVMHGKCSYCKWVKFCAGGCRSYNYFVNQDKDLYHSPHCVQQTMINTTREE